MSRTARRTACLMLSEIPPEGVEPLWEALGHHSPDVELASGEMGGFYLDATGMVPRYDDEANWCRAVLAAGRALGHEALRLGLAGTRFAARVAAQTAPSPPGYRIVTESDARFLAPLPVDGLPLEGEILRRLRLLGLGTMGQLAALPGSAVAEQFGPESLPPWRWAKGQDERPVLGRRCQGVSASWDFEVPEARRAALLEAACHLAERALADLPVDRRVWALQRATLTAHTAEGDTLRHSAWLGTPPGPETLRALWDRLIPQLGGQGEGLVSLTVSLWGLEPAPGRQMTLLEAQESDRRWHQVVQTLEHKHPEGLLRPALADPAAPILTERYTFYRWSR